MGSLEIFIIAIGLAMDAFAVSVANGVAIKEVKISQALVFGLYFGFFQFGMTLVGFFAGKFFAGDLTQWGGWIAFALLTAIGCNMIIDAVRKKHNSESICKTVDDIMKWSNMAILAVATSLDALIVGIGLAVISQYIFSSALTIGLYAFILSIAGVLLGNGMNKYLKNYAEVFGGIILIALGLKILLGSL